VKLHVEKFNNISAGKDMEKCGEMKAKDLLVSVLIHIVET